MYSTELLMEVYINKARAALENKDLETAESYLLRANRADIILSYYRELEMWPEALRIAKEYVPESLKQIQVNF